jgi:hypothetical protein
MVGGWGSRGQMNKACVLYALQPPTLANRKQDFAKPTQFYVRSRKDADTWLHGAKEYVHFAAKRVARTCGGFAGQYSRTAFPRCR